MADLPTGTVTFLFTDIEGSTRLWEQHPDAMHHALARHDEILRTATAAHHGHVFNAVGDGFCVAFATTPDALAAAVLAQQMLDVEPWGDVGPLRVRMALHTGTAQERDGDYFGPVLNRTARLLAAGHGGQILASLATEGGIRNRLPRDVSLRDLGERRLKDLVRPERLYQVVVSGLPATFPPLRTLDARRHNLPQQPTPLIGRESELASVRRRLMQPDTRLLTLTGPGGTGKTRMSLQLAADLIDDFAHGVFFVSLAPISDPAVVPSLVAEVIGVREEAYRSIVDTLLDTIRDQHLLLVLDNFEHVIESASFVAHLLTACTHLKVVTTSRTILHIYGEREFFVPPLSLPGLDQQPTLDQLHQFESIRLFVDRVRDFNPDFAVTAENAQAVTAVCHQVDGLPLAIELAAVRVKTLSPQALLARLARRLPLLTGGGRDRPVRQQTLRNLIAWSYDLLIPSEQLLFQRLAVFAGGCSVEAAGAVCSVESDVEEDMLDMMTSLMEQSLLRQEDTIDGEPRFVMLETIREYALDRLVATGEAVVIRRQHATYFLEYARQGRLELSGTNQSVWLGKLRMEHDNMRAALSWLEDEGDSTTALDFAGTLWGFWAVQGHYREGRQRLTRLLEATSSGERAAERAQALSGVGLMADEQGDYAAARGYLEEAVMIWRERGEQRRIASALHNLGSVFMHEGDFEAARMHTRESHDIWRDVGNERGVAHALNNLGLIASNEGNSTEACTLLEESLKITRRFSDQRGIATALLNLADIAMDAGRLSDAAKACEESLAIRVELGDQRGMTETLEGCVCLFAASGSERQCDPWERAIRLSGAVAALREAIGTAPSAPQKARLDQSLAPVREGLGRDTSAALWKEGWTMPLKETLASLPPLLQDMTATARSV